MNFPTLKRLLTKLGVFVSPRVIHHFDGVLNYLVAGRWFHDRGITIPVRVKTRFELYALVAKGVEEPVVYLEFGVFQGEATREWARLLRHPETRFHGFDSFEGLPETWGQKCDKATFNVQGRIPDLGDARVTFHKGWFTETVPKYVSTFSPAYPLIVHLDADLYSSTIYPLRQLQPWLRERTILIFDEFFDREHEMKALSEFLDEEGARVECIGATTTLTQVAFRVVRPPG
jgi:Methyltransferase domain